MYSVDLRIVCDLSDLDYSAVSVIQVGIFIKSRVSQLLVALCATLPLFAFANRELSSLQAVIDAVQSGKPLRVVIDFKQCTPSLAMQASYQPSSIMLVNKAVLFSDWHSTLRSPAFSGKAVIEVINYQLSGDQNLAIDTTVIDAKTLQPLSEHVAHVSCPLNQAAHFFSLS